MKKLLLIILFAFGIQAIQASDSKHLQIQVDSLTEKVDSLSNELSFLELSYELYTLNTDIQMFNYDVNNQLTDMKFSILHDYCDKEAYRKLKKLYNSFKERIEAIKELMEKKGELFVVTFVVSNFTEAQIDILSHNYKMAEAHHHQSEFLLEAMKEHMDWYEKRI